jgi:hypothetical protein
MTTKPRRAMRTATVQIGTGPGRLVDNRPAVAGDAAGWYNSLVTSSPDAIEERKTAAEERARIHRAAAAEAARQAAVAGDERERERG